LLPSSDDAPFPALAPLLLCLLLAVKLSQRKQLVDTDGKSWHDWVQAQPTGKKLSDPRRYSVEQLADFLASLSSQKPDPRAPGKELVKPCKLLKRYLPWLTDRIQVSTKGACARPSRTCLRQTLQSFGDKFALWFHSGVHGNDWRTAAVAAPVHS
jgi:hypothetical protein